MLGFPIGLLYANAGEWLIHRYLLHGLGRDRKSFWAFHWYDHHKSARQLDMEDPAYQRRLFEKWDPQTKEAVALIGAAVAHLPIGVVSPGFVAGVWFSAANYYRVHKKSHLDPEWAKKHLRWHWDHHMGPDQDANWCVTFPLFDHIMGTRKPFLDTPEEREGRPQREAFAARAKAARAEKEAAGDTRDAA